MESIQSESAPSNSIPFKSKKPLLTTTTTPKKKPPPPPSSAVVTPEKFNPPPSARIRNHNFALSVSDIRKTALKLRKPNSIGSDIPGRITQKLGGNGSADAKPKSSERSAALLPEKYELDLLLTSYLFSDVELISVKCEFCLAFYWDFTDFHELVLVLSVILLLNHECHLKSAEI